MSVAEHEAGPRGMPPIAFTYEVDGQPTLRSFGSAVPVPYPDASTAPPANVSRSLRKGYYAAVSWTDHQVGRLLDALDEHAVAGETVVALAGDHGWALGEHNIWGKHSNFEVAARVPLILRTPGGAGRRQPGLVELVDLYPTLAALAGLPPPPDVDGADLSGLVLGGGGAGKEAAFSEYPRCPRRLEAPWDDLTSCTRTRKEDFRAMGYSVRTDGWRLTAWLRWDGARLVGDFSQPPVGVELYAHPAGEADSDFDATENVNVADLHPAVVRRLMGLAEAHWGKGPGEPVEGQEPRGREQGGVAGVEQGKAADASMARVESDAELLRMQFEEWWAGGVSGAMRRQWTRSTPARARPSPARAVLYRDRFEPPG